MLNLPREIGFLQQWACWISQGRLAFYNRRRAESPKGDWLFTTEGVLNLSREIGFLQQGACWISQGRRSINEFTRERLPSLGELLTRINSSICLPVHLLFNELNEARPVTSARFIKQFLIKISIKMTSVLEPCSTPLSFAKQWIIKELQAERSDQNLATLRNVQGSKMVRCGLCSVQEMTQSAS